MEVTKEMLDELEAKAKASGGERWICIDGDGVDTDHRLITTEARLAAPTVQIATVHYGHPDAGMLEPFQSEQVAAGEHIAAANPATILALVEHIRSQAAELENSRAALAMHDKIERETHAELERCKAGLAVPDKMPMQPFTTIDRASKNYAAGWNACRAAMQPAGTTSDKYRAELYDEVWEKARGMGYGNVTNALVELERMKAAEQPAPVAAPSDFALRSRVADLLHLLQFAKFETSSPGDAAQAEVAMNDLERMLAAPATPGAQEPVAWVCDVLQADGTFKRELSFEAPPENGVTYSIRNRVPLYTAPPAAEQPDTVNVPRAVLERIAPQLVWDSEEYRELRALLAEVK